MKLVIVKTRIDVYTDVFQRCNILFNFVRNWPLL